MLDLHPRGKLETEPAGGKQQAGSTARHEDWVFRAEKVTKVYRNGVVGEESSTNVVSGCALNKSWCRRRRQSEELVSRQHVRGVGAY